jgi:LysR family carnitine catabolism transcriptional activator
VRINLQPRQLLCFLRVAELESFSLAARELAVSQPALSRTIQQVEAEIGARLFDRTTRNVTLTPAGAELRPIASRLVAEFEGAFGELALFVVGRRGRVVVAALPSVAAVLLPPAIVGFQADFPDVEVSIQDGLSGSVLDAVREGRADIGITMGPSPSDTLAYTPLLSDEFGLVCRQDSPLAAKQVAPWSIFSEHRFIAMSPASSVRQMTDAAFLQAGVAVRPLYGCSFLGTAGHLVAAGLGITALPLLTMPLIAPQPLCWRRLERPVMHRQIGVVTRLGRSLAPAARNFLTALTLAAEQIG